MNNKYNLTIPQKSILLMEQYYSNTNINNICGTASIKESVDFNNLEKELIKVLSNRRIHIFVQYIYNFCIQHLRYTF